LKLIAAAVRLDFSNLTDEVFDVEYELSFSTGTIVASMRNERVEPLQVEKPVLHVRDTEMFSLSATLQFRFTEPAKAWTVCADSSSIWREDRESRRLPLRIYPGDRGPDLLLSAFHVDPDDSLGAAYDSVF